MKKEAVSLSSKGGNRYIRRYFTCRSHEHVFFFLNSYALSYLPTANSDIRQEFDHVSCGIADSFGVEPLKFQGRRFLFL